MFDLVLALVGVEVRDLYVLVEFGALGMDFYLMVFDIRVAILLRC